MEHVFTESMFLVGFVIFIAAILVLDMLVIDRKAHVVSIKEAGSWTAVWIILALAFAVFIYFHGDMVHGIENFDDLKLIASRYASHLKLDPNDYEGSLQQYRHYMTISYISGYLIEKTLSVDNLFVMMMIFTSFGVNKKDYQHVLNWGILGAIVLRFVFIFAGAALISRFAWILLVFGGFLVYSGAKMFLNRNKKEEINALEHPVVKFMQKRLHLGPLVMTVVFIEFCDLIFAFDSIPAVFSVSLDPFVVFFSNIFAILGLRALFFLLAAIADKFRYLKVGVSVLLVFIGVKMLIHDFFEIDAVSSLVFISIVLLVSIGASVVIPQKQEALENTK